MLVLDHGLGKVSGRASEQVFLLPGQWYFGARGELVRTLLGSCVALTLWHPQRHCGGMCHFLLPDRQRVQGAEPDGRYGEEAVELLVKAMARHGTQPNDYVVELYGGADTMPDQVNMKFNVGERNIEKALTLIDHYGLQLSTVDVGGNEPRNVLLDLRNGQVQLRRGHPHPSKAPVHAAAPKTARPHQPASGQPPHPIHHRAPPHAKPALAAHKAPLKHAAGHPAGTHHTAHKPTHASTHVPAHHKPAAHKPVAGAPHHSTTKPAQPHAPHQAAHPAKRNLPPATALPPGATPRKKP